MIATRRLWAAKPFLVAYVAVLGVTIGLLVNRTPTGDRAVTTLATPSAQPAPREVEARGEPLWLQIFRPSQPTARIMLRTGLPVLGLLERDSQANRSLSFWTAAAVEKPQTLFQSALPFLRPAAAAPSDPGATGQASSSTGQPTAGAAAPSAAAPHQAAGTPSNSGAPALPPAPVPALVQQGASLIGIYHSHDYESYISEFPNMKPTTESDLDTIVSYDHKKRTVVDLGVLLAQNLRNLGVSTIQAPWNHQDRGYAYAYQASRDTARRILKEGGTVRILLDLHRDSAWGVDTTTEINGQPVARIRCIIGAANPHADQNKQFCSALMERLNRAYPGITLPTREQDSIYNQDLMPGAILLEIGGAMNQYAEAQRSINYLAQVLAEMVREGAYPH